MDLKWAGTLVAKQDSSFSFFGELIGEGSEYVTHTDHGVTPPHCRTTLQLNAGTPEELFLP